MDTSYIRIATSNLVDSIISTMQNFESQTIGRTSGIETDIMGRHGQVLQVMSQLYSDIIDLVYQDKDLAKVFYIKSKLEQFNSLPLTNSEAEGYYIGILQSKLNSLNTNLDPSC